MERIANLTVYTAIFGDIDQLHPPLFSSPNVTYVAFVETDFPYEHNGWQCRPPFFRHENLRRQARQHKLLAHVLFPDEKYTLWLDGSFTPKNDPRIFGSGLREDVPLATFNHSQRSCVYQELEACVRLRKDDISTMRQQVGRYFAEGYPYHNGLVETCVVLRRREEKTDKFNELWWKELSNGSLRDQLSFNYAAWKLQMKYTAFDGNVFQCPHFEFRSHLGRRKECV